MVVHAITTPIPMLLVPVFGLDVRVNTKTPFEVVRYELA